MINQQSVLEIQSVAAVEIATVMPLTQGELLDELKIVAALHADEGHARQALEYYHLSLKTKK